MPDILLFLSRSNDVHAEVHAWLERHARPLSVQTGLLSLLGLPAETAAGPITAVGLGLTGMSPSMMKNPLPTPPEPVEGPQGEGTKEHCVTCTLKDRAASWCLASPLHLRADLSSVLLFGPESLAMTDAEAQSLAGGFNRHFADRNLRLAVNPGQGWLLHSEMSLGANLGPAARASLDIRDLGPEARPWQALLLEIQMLFHAHPINAGRQSRGLPVINGLWPEGCGSLADIPAVQTAPWLKMLVSESPWVKGLAQLSAVPCVSLDTAMAQGQVWYLPDGHDKADDCLAICHKALTWQAANKGAEVWLKAGDQVWQSRQPGLLSRLFGYFSF